MGIKFQHMNWWGTQSLSLWQYFCKLNLLFCWRYLGNWTITPQTCLVWIFVFVVLTILFWPPWQLLDMPLDIRLWWPKHVCCSVVFAYISVTKGGFAGSLLKMGKGAILCEIAFPLCLPIWDFYLTAWHPQILGSQVFYLCPLTFHPH